MTEWASLWPSFVTIISKGKVFFKVLTWFHLKLTIRILSNISAFVEFDVRKFFRHISTPSTTNRILRGNNRFLLLLIDNFKTFFWLLIFDLFYSVIIILFLFSLSNIDIKSLIVHSIILIFEVLIIYWFVILFFEYYQRWRSKFWFWNLKHGVRMLDRSLTSLAQIEVLLNYRLITNSCNGINSASIAINSIVNRLWIIINLNSFSLFLLVLIQLFKNNGDSPINLLLNNLK